MRYLLVILMATLVQAGVLKQTIDFKAGEFDFSQRDGYSVVLGSEMDVTDDPGAPQLPVRPVVLTLPGNCEVSEVRVNAAGWVLLERDAVLFPCQKQVILCQVANDDWGMTNQNPAIYESKSPYPASPAVWTGTGQKAGNTVVDLLVYPLRYVGAEGRVEFCPEFDVEVDYRRRMTSDEWGMPNGAFDYVIVTSSSYDSIFQRLADWKTQKGVPTVVRDIAWVYANYSGRDSPERLRNYVKTLPDSGVKFVLLGGDVAVVPYRKAFAMASEGHIHTREDSLPCDLYFADLDGDWDRNGNNVFGEVADSVDLYPEVAVGRAPVDTRTEAQNFVNKVLEYEKTPAMGAQDNVLFFAEIMWSNPYTDGGKHKDMLEAESFASGYTVTKKYERLGNESRSSVMAAIRDGQNYMNHDGHGWIDVMSCGSYPYLDTDDADTITNAYRGIMYSIGCWTAAYDFNYSIGEAFVYNGNGGTVAFIGNSSYGWGSPGNPGFGYSDKFDDKFWYMMQHCGRYSIGDAMNGSKEYYVPFSRGENVYRWHQYEVNLMGCPEMPVWTAVPETLTVVAPDEIPIGRAELLVTVSHDGAAVPGARVCLMKGEESYSRGLTDQAGRVWLETTPQAAGDFTLTVTAQNYLPSERTIPCVSGEYVNFAGWVIDDSPGNNDGIANPMETINLPTWLHNAGNATSGAVSMVLRTGEICVDLADSTASVAAMNAGDSIYIADAFQIDVRGYPEDGQVFRFDLVVTDAFGTRTFHPVVLVGMPVLALERYYLTNPPALPGTTRDLKVAIENRGHGFGHGTWARLTSLDGNVTVLEPESIPAGELVPLELHIPGDSFRVSVSGACPESYLAEMVLETWCEDYRFADTFELLVGNYGFEDDLESGDSKWSHGGSGDRWNLSSHRYHSDNHSWYCGDNSTHRYSNNMNAWLMTDEFMVAENCSLKFWRWFSVPNYGVDGIYVIIVRDGHADTLDFIGTGGALGDKSEIRSQKSEARSPEAHAAGAPEPLNPRPLDPSLLGIECDWYQEKYDLSWIPAGETIQVRLPFKSDGDGDIGEGFYIDDVEVTGGGPPLTFVAEMELGLRSVPQLLCWPNPFTRSLNLKLVSCSGRSVSGRVFDATGRVVRTFSMPVRHARADWVWDGVGDNGRRLGAGAYFVEVRAGSRSLIGKVLLTR